MREAFRIDPEAIYDDAALVLGLGVAQTALTQARRVGHLRSTRKGHRVLYRGQWIVDWLERDKGGEDDRQ